MTSRASLAMAAFLLPAVTLGQTSQPRTARIVGVVADSISNAGLSGAEVIVSGVAASIRTDALGRFTVDSLQPGTYQVGVFHPLLDALGLTLASAPFTIGADSTAAVRLAVPSAATLVARYCGAAATDAKPAVLVGRVLDPDTEKPVAAATVSVAWQEVEINKRVGVRSTPHELHAAADSSGFYSVCGLPADLEGTIAASQGGFSTPEIPLTLTGARLAIETLKLSTASGSERLGGTVNGKVVDADGRPLAGARVQARGAASAALSREDGTFSIAGVPTGTQIIEARRIGFEAATQAVNVSSREPASAVLAMERPVNVMDPVLVTARANYRLARVGFVKRQAVGLGKFITRDEIDRRKPYSVTDMFTAMNGITVAHGPGGAVLASSSPSRSLMGGNRGCVNVWVDGFEWRNLAAGDLDSFLNPRDLAGIEVYREGEAPAQFRPSLGDECAVVVIWTELHTNPKGQK